MEFEFFVFDECCVCTKVDCVMRLKIKGRGLTFGVQRILQTSNSETLSNAITTLCTEMILMSSNK